MKIKKKYISLFWVTGLVAGFLFILNKENLAQVQKIAKEVQRQKVFIKVFHDNSLQYVMPEIYELFKNNPENLMNDVFTSKGASGLLAQKIQTNSERPNIFISCSKEIANATAKLKGWSSPKLIFKNRIILYAPKPQTLLGQHFSRSKKDLSEQHVREILLAPGINKILISDPKVSPVGKAAWDLLQKLNLYKRLEKKITIVDSLANLNVMLLAQAADLGFTSESLVYAKKDKGKPRSNFENLYFSYLNEQLAPKLEYFVSVFQLADEKKNKLAEAYEKFLFTAPVKKIFAEYSFQP